MISPTVMARKSGPPRRVPRRAPLRARSKRDLRGVVCHLGGPLLRTLKVQAREADKLESHLKDIPAVKPGSRGLA